MLALVSSVALSKELITLEIGTSPSQPNNPAYLKTIDVANQLQDKYEFVAEFKPGANGALALRTMDSSPLNRLATIAPAFVENSKQGLINEADYAPIASQGDACWAIITNVGDTKQGLSSLRGQQEITVGGTGFGNAAHITSIMLGEKYGFKVRYIVYKANYDALVAMAGGQPINFVIERIQNYQNFKDKNPKMQVLGINCPNRNPAMPEVKTLREQGLETPTIFFAIVANVKMPEEKRREIAKIWYDAQQQVGAKYFLETADVLPPQFTKLSVSDFFVKRTSQMHYLTNKYKEQIDAAR